MTPSLRWATAAIVVLLGLMFRGCPTLSEVSPRLPQTDSGLENIGSGATNQYGTQPPLQTPNQTTPAVAWTGDPNIIIGSFNIQMFGKTKMSRPDVVDVLVDITRRFDILAIQELRDVNQNVIPEFLELVNQDGSRYAAAVGPRQGYKINNNNYFEQAVFIYDTTKFRLLSQTYVAPNRNERMHRTPYVGHFECLPIPGAGNPFSFVLMNIHTDFDDAQYEFEVLQEVIPEIYANHQGEDDFILLGDLNDAPQNYQRFNWMRNQYAGIGPQLMTNTRKTKAYDNIIFDRLLTSEYRAQAGVLDLMSQYQLTLDQALLVSDHLPVWAVFSAIEAPAAAITQDPARGFVR